ncbi:MAG: membrane protein insertion efficiency factor YidD [Verrucomicrobia bacterium]|nr:membrane protein insertion efficiency factor YidD [Verrucomicrobiota bacterium]
MRDLLHAVCLTFTRAVRFLVIALLYLYRYLLSPFLHMIAPGAGCRFTPTCSEYAMEAVQRFGPFRGGWLALKRLARCHPLGGWGHDPVPQGSACTGQGDPQHASSFPSPETRRPSVSGKKA